MFKTDLKYITIHLVWFVVASLVATLIPIMAMIDVRMQLVITEQSFTEISQTVMLLASCAVVFRASRLNDTLKPACILLSAFFLCLALRENDTLFNSIYQSLWFVIGLIVAALAFGYTLLLGRFSHTVHSLANFARGRFFPGFCGAFILVFVISRLLGMTEIWDMMADALSLTHDQYYPLKTFAEECVESYGYYILLVFSLGLLHELRRPVTHAEHPTQV
ncbi:MAG: hypothetical protein K6A65_01210 [Succinivibrionaceae bacterium]|nr:hypothetical protein [Succinivibrionaceae bacterium]